MTFTTETRRLLAELVHSHDQAMQRVAAAARAAGATEAEADAAAWSALRSHLATVEAVTL